MEGGIPSSKMAETTFTPNNCASATGLEESRPRPNPGVACRAQGPRSLLECSWVDHPLQRRRACGENHQLIGVDWYELQIWFFGNKTKMMKLTNFIHYDCFLQNSPQNSGFVWFCRTEIRMSFVWFIQQELFFEAARCIAWASKPVPVWFIFGVYIRSKVLRGMSPPKSLVDNMFWQRI